MLLMIAACSKQEDASKSGITKEGAVGSVTEKGQLFDIESIARGAKLYQENCTQCHGPHAQGHPDWAGARDKAYVAAPPLNGTGTDITLSRKKMIKVIRKGVRRKGTPVMPAWQGRISDAAIVDIINWYQALWPTETYQRWRANVDNLSNKKG